MKNYEAILEVIKESREHLTADAIYLEVKKKKPSIAVGTVYRNLSQMVEKKMIGCVKGSDGAAKYDKSATSHPHGQCRECGSLFDIKSDALDEAIRNAVGDTECQYQLTVSCLCEKCKEKHGK